MQNPPGVGVRKPLGVGVQSLQEVCCTLSEGTDITRLEAEMDKSIVTVRDFSTPFSVINRIRIQKMVSNIKTWPVLQT